MTQDKETLREAVAVIVEQSLLRHGVQLSRQEGTLDDADAAIATMFERLRTPSEGVIEAGKAIGRYEGHHAYCRHIEDDTVPCVCGYLAAHNSLRDAIDKFQQENSDER